MKNLFLVLPIILLIILSSFKLSAQNKPEDILIKFCTMRSDFSFADRDHWDEYDSLVVWEYEPGWDRAFMIDTFYISNIKQEGYRAFIDVSYKTLGIFSGNEWHPHDTTEVTHFILINTVEGWKVDRPCENPRVLLYNFIKNSDQDLERFYKDIQSISSNKRAYEEAKKMYDKRVKAFSEMKKVAEAHKKGNY